MAPPQRATCETDSEDDHSSTPRPPPSRTKSHSSSSSATARRDSKVGSRRPVDKNSDSGYSTGTKGSADTGHAGRPAADKAESAEPPSSSPTKSSRSTKEKRLSSSKSQTSQRSSTKSAPAPSRAPSTKSRSSASSDKKNEEKERRHSRHSDHAAPSSNLHAAVGTSPTSSRSSRTPSSSSQEMPPPASTVHSRPRSYSQSRQGRPASYHAGMGPMESMYAYYEHGPPPSRSAYVDKGAHHVRPGLMILPPTPTYPPTMAPHGGALQPSLYDPARMALRTQADYAATSGGSPYSARRPNVLFPDQPASYDPAAVLPPSPPSRSRSRQRAPVNPRKAADVSLFDDDSDPEFEFDDDYDTPGAQSMPMRRPSMHEKRSSWGPRTTRGVYTPYGTSPYGTPYGTSPYGTSPAAEFPPYDARYDEAYAAHGDYRPSARSHTITSSSRSRHASVASSGGGTRGTSYSQSSGSGTYTSSNHQRSLYEHPRGNMPLDLTAAEMYMNSMDRKANHTRHQQPAQLTQESLRLAQARTVEGKRSSKGGAAPSVVSSSYANSLRSRTVTASDDQAVKVLINTTAGLDLALEGDTEGRPIRLVQKPGEETAQLFIGTGPGRREDTAYYHGGDNSKSSGRSRVTMKSGSTKAAVTGRRGRSRTTAE